MTSPAPKTVTLVVAGIPTEAWSVTAPGFIAFDPATSEVEITAAPTFSVTPDTLTAIAGRVTFDDELAWSEGLEGQDENDSPGFDWDQFVKFTDHNITTTPLPWLNEYTAELVQWTATKAGGYPPITTYSNLLYLPKFERKSGAIVVTGGSRPLLAGETIDVDVSGVTFSITPDETSVVVSVVMPDGSRVVIPPDAGAPTPATVTFVGGVSTKTPTMAIPTHIGADTALGVFSGTSLNANKPALVADGWVIDPRSEVLFGGYDTFVAHRYLDAPGTALPALPNLQRAVLGVYRGLSPTNPIADLAMTLNNDAAATDIVLPPLATLPAGSYVVRARGVNNRNGTFPADAGLTQRAEVNTEAGTFYAFALADTNGVATSIAESTVALGYASRTVAYAIGLRAGDT